jgi:hypothetical protein
MLRFNHEENSWQVTVLPDVWGNISADYARTLACHGYKVL